MLASFNGFNLALILHEHEFDVAGYQLFALTKIFEFEAEGTVNGIEVSNQEVFQDLSEVLVGNDWVNFAFEYLHH